MLNKLLLMIGSTFALLLPIKGLLILIFTMVIIDTIYAVYASVKIKGIKSFKSSLLRKGMTPKIFGYLGSTILLFSIDTMFFGGVLFGVNLLLSKSVAMIWVYNESKSLDETSQKLGNRPFVQVAKEAIGFFSKAKKEVGDLIEIGSEGDKEESTK